MYRPLDNFQLLFLKLFFFFRFSFSFENGSLFVSLLFTVRCLHYIFIFIRSMVSMTV